MSKRNEKYGGNIETSPSPSKGGGLDTNKLVIELSTEG